MENDESSVVLRAPAKINLGLRIVGARQDGYHEIQSLFVPISLYDELSLSHATGSSTVNFFTSEGKSLSYQNDTLSRTLEVLKRAEVLVPPLDIRVTKNIPAGSGLGGGSSNAGILLRYLYERFAPLPDDTQSQGRMIQLALQIGADVPFFLRKGPSLVWGIGERLKPARIEPFAVLVATPSFSVSSRDAYLWFDKESTLTRRDTDATTALIEGVGGASTLTLREIFGIMKNDLEKPVGTRHPEIGILKKALSDSGALGSLMSGSGSSVYGVFKDLSQAKMAREKLQHNFPSNYAFFACETLV